MRKDSIRHLLLFLLSSAAALAGVLLPFLPHANSPSHPLQE